MKVTQLLLPFPKRKPKMVQMTFRFKKESNMKLNPIKFFRNTKSDEPLPSPIITKSGNKQRFEFIRKGKKLDKFM